MIKQIVILNFQCHKKLDIKLGRVTTIIGDNDKGKSAVLRALRWVCENRPGGDRFIRRGATYAEVRVYIGKHVITRKKGHGLNEYTLNGDKYEAFGLGRVPQPIVQVLNTGDTNFQGQWDKAFWLSDTPGQVSKHLNSIVNLQLIDQSLSKAASKVKEAKHKASFSQERLRQAKQQRISLKWVCGARKLADKATKLDKTIQRMTQEHAQLAQILIQLKERGQNLKKLEMERVGLVSVSKLGSKLTALEQEVNRVSGLIHSIKQKDKEINKWEKELCLMGKTMTRLTKGKVCPICKRQM